MSRLRLIFAASFAACLFGRVAIAQPTSPPAAAPTNSPSASQVQSAPAAADHATQASANTMEPASATVAVTVDANGDRRLVISSPPVPDTPENRAKYGQPLSNAGRHTQPAGN
jgi:hypothetical protein